jgi:hypothetical protein
MTAALGRRSSPAAGRWSTVGTAWAPLFAATLAGARGGHRQRRAGLSPALFAIANRRVTIPMPAGPNR